MPCLEALALTDWRLTGSDGTDVPATVPGTVAGALRAAGGDPWREDLDDHEWTFTCAFDGGVGSGFERLVLRLDGLATLCAVSLNGAPLLDSRSMWSRHRLDVTDRVRPGANELVVRCLPLAPEIRRPRKPRARWRTRLVAQGLRFQRTMLLGRAPGFAAAPACVGPWRPVVLEADPLPEVMLRTRLDGTTGVLIASLPPSGVFYGNTPDDPPLTAPGVGDLVLRGLSGEHRGPLGEALRVPDVARWWPHTHGEPVLHDVALALEDREVPLGRVGFRALENASADPDGLALRVNGVDVFARGAVWTPVDLVGMAPDPAEVLRTLERLRDAGMNLVRVVGTATYEDDVFWDACDALGLLVWQDLMLANLDYPWAEEGFRAALDDEVDALCGQIAGRPSLAVLCGGSEVEQQVAMLGQDPALARDAIPPDVVARLRDGLDAAWLSNAPSGRPSPLRPDVGVANWFGVGGYGRPVSEVRHAGVRFASECLAFAHVPGEPMLAGAGIDAGVPRDAGATWDFADVRDGYLRDHWGLDPQLLRRTDPVRHAALSQAISGELSAAVLGHWRRASDPCRGGVVLWWRDLVPGAGWGLLDSDGHPKPAWHLVRRALAPVALWATDESLGGLALHVANDGPQPLAATLEVTLLRHGREPVATGATSLQVGAHITVEHRAEDVLGRFADVSWAYRFGPPAHDTVVATLRGADEMPLARTLFFPLGPPLDPRPPAALGARARLDGAALIVEADAVLHRVAVHAEGARAADELFDVVPGEPVVVALDGVPEHVEISALNLDGRVAAAPVSVKTP